MELWTWNSKVFQHSLYKLSQCSALLVFTGRQIFYKGGLIFYINSTGTKVCVTAADLSDFDENLNCFTRTLSSCYIKISVVSQYRNLVAVQYEQRASSVYFYWLTTCTCWTAQWLRHWWHRLKLLNDSRRTTLMTDSRHTSLETQTQIWNWLRRGHTVHRPYTAYKQYTAGCPWCPQSQKSCILISRLTPTPMHKKC